MHSELLFEGEEDKEKNETTLNGNPVPVNIPLETETRISTDWYYFNYMTAIA